MSNKREEGLPISHESKEILTRKEMMELLKVSEGTLVNWRKQGILSSHKIGGRVFYRMSDLQKLFNTEKTTK